MDNLAQRVLKGYELQERIGEGNFGVVYRACQSSIGREVAIKVILPQHSNQVEFIRRFEAEAQLIARLEHPHIVPLYDYWRDPGGAYLVMRLLRGNLRSVIQQGPWSPDKTAQLLEQVAAALMVAHREDVVHHDIKPDNILLDEDDNAYLSDFSIAKDLNLRNEAEVSAESPDYVTPEQIKGEAVTPLSDIYSLGLVIYELLVGEKPFARSSTPDEIIARHLNEPLPSLIAQRANLPAALNEVLQTATAKEPAHRYTSVARFAAAFRAATPGRRRISSQPLADPLTERELDILRLMVAGASNETIAQQLYLTIGTVRWYVKQVYSKLDVHNRQQALERVQALNILKAHPDPGLVDELASEHLSVLTKASAALDRPEPVNPFKGLRAFQEGDSADFFGRAALTEHLLGSLAENGNGARFVCLVGPSGSGKSSAVNAGLIPTLRQGGLPHSASWFITSMLPGTHPLEELEAALLRVAVIAIPELLHQLREDRRGLVRAAKRILPGDQDTELLLVIDQFEELFTLLEDEAARAHFIDLLLAAVTDPRSRVRVALTLRADFYDRPLQYPRLAELLRSHTEVIVPLTLAELERAIAGPAERVGLILEHGLVTTIVNEVAAQPGALPSLQYALTELYERREGITLTLDAYRASGGITGALARRADELYEKMDEAGQQAARQMFLRLITLGEGTEDTRRRVLLAELESVAGDGRAMDDVVEAFSYYRLLTFDRDPLTRGPTVEVAHEAFIREWERLRAWLDESRDDIRMQRQLTAKAQEWREGNQDTSFLIGGLRLEQFERWAAETTMALTAEESDYLDASIAERERQAQAQEKQEARARSLERRSRNFLSTLVVVLVLATLGAFGLTSVAVNQSIEARHAADVSRSLALAADSQLALNADRGDLALMLGQEAIKIPNAPARAQLTLSEVAYAPGTRWFLNDFEGTPKVPVVSPDGRYVAFGLGRPFLQLPREEDNTIRLVDLKTSEQVRVFEGHRDGVAPLAFSHDGRYLVSGALDPISGSPETGIILWDVGTGEMIRAYRHEAKGFPFLFAFTPDNRYFLSLSIDENFTFVQGSITLWDLESGQAVRHLANGVGTINAGAFSPDGRYLVVILDDTPESLQTRILVFDTLSGEQIRTITAEGPTVAVPGGIAISASNIMALSNSEAALSTWDIETGTLIHRFDSQVTSRAFANSTFYMPSPDGRTLVTGSQTGEIQLHDLETWAEIVRFRGHSDFVFALAFTPDGQQLVSCAFDGVRLWDLGNGALAQHYPAPPQVDLRRSVVRNVAFMPDGQSFVSLSLDGTLVHRSSESGDILHHIQVPTTTQSGVWGLAVSPDARSVLVGIWPDKAALYDLATGQVKVTLPHLSDPDVPFGVSVVDISPDGRTALTGAQERSDGMVLWNLTTGAELHRFETSLEPINTDFLISLAYSHDGRQVLAGLANGVMILYDLETYQEIRRFGGNDGQTGFLFDVDFSPDGRLGLSTSGDGTLTLWDLESGARLHRLVGHSGEIRMADFSPDGKLVASGARDETIILWDVTTGEAIRRLRWAGSAGVFSLAFSPDGQYIVAGNGFAQNSLWRVDSTLHSLIDWTQHNRYIPQPTCEERELYRLLPMCEDNG